MKLIFQRAWHFVFYSEVVRQSAVVAAGNVAVAGVMALAMLLTSRSLGPEKFGIFSVGLAIMAVLARVVDAGTNQLVPRFMNRWHDEPLLIRQFLSHVSLWKLYLSLATVFLGVLFIPFSRSVLHYNYGGLILWAIFGSLVMGLYEHVILVLSARHKFFDGVVLSVLQAVIKLVGLLLLFFLAREWLPGYVAVFYIAPLVALYWVMSRQKEDFLLHPQVASSQVRKAVTPFIGHAFLSVLAATVLGNLDILMIQRSLSSFDAGIYSGASRIALLISFTVAAMGGVLTNRVSRYRDKATLRLYLKKSLILVSLSVLGFVCFLPFARWILVFSIGPEYISGLLPLIALVANSFLLMALLPYIAIFYSIDRPFYFSFSGVLQIITIFLGNAFFLEQYGLVAAATTKLFATVLYLIFTLGYLTYVWRKIET